MRTQRGCRRQVAPHRRSGLLSAVAKGEPPPATGKGIPLCAPNSPHVKTAIVGGPHVPAAWLPPASGPHRRPGLLSAVAVGEPSPAASHCRQPPPKAYHRRPKQPARQGRYSRWPACAHSVAAAGKQLSIGDPGSSPPSPGESPHRPPPTAAGHRQRHTTVRPKEPARQDRYIRWPACAHRVDAAANKHQIGDRGS